MIYLRINENFSCVSDLYTYRKGFIYYQVPKSLLIIEDYYGLNITVFTFLLLFITKIWKFHIFKRIGWKFRIPKVPNSCWSKRLVEFKLIIFFRASYYMKRTDTIVKVSRFFFNVPPERINFRAQVEIYNYNLFFVFCFFFLVTWTLFCSWVGKGIYGYFKIVQDFSLFTFSVLSWLMHHQSSDLFSLYSYVCLLWILYIVRIKDLFSFSCWESFFKLLFFNMASTFFWHFFLCSAVLPVLFQYNKYLRF